MPEDWEGFPLRKDYPVQLRKDASTAMPLQVTEEEFKASMERDRYVRGGPSNQSARDGSVPTSLRAGSRETGGGTP
jgi:hypothetical protein